MGGELPQPPHTALLTCAPTTAPHEAVTVLALRYRRRVADRVNADEGGHRDQNGAQCHFDYFNDPLRAGI